MRNINWSDNMPLRFETITSNTELVEYLQKCYWNSKQFENILPYLIKSSTSFELSLALSDAVQITKRHTNRLIQIFDSLQERVKSLRCERLQNHFNDLQKIADYYPSGFSLDNAIILQCQKIMSYDITVMAGILEKLEENSETSVSHYLSTAIAEEKDAHAILTEIALQSIYFHQAV